MKWKDEHLASEIYYGREGKGAMGHRDGWPLAILQFILEGRKRYWLCTPTLGVVEEFWDGDDEDDGFDLKAYAETNAYEENGCVTITAEKGDVVWIPDGWWHMTENLETPTIAVHESVLTSRNHKKVYQLWKAECQEQEETTCKYVEKCAKIWNEEFDCDTKNNNEL